MKIHISRQGIVIRTIEVRGDKATIGSGADRDVRLDDPYLAAHVADVVNRGGEWRIVDAATSIEGITHNGRRVEDEPLVSGERYTLGAFELVVEGANAATAPSPRQAEPAAAPQSPQGADPGRPPIPKTMFEAAVPGGMPETPPPPPPPVSPQNQQAQPGFQPITPPPGARPSAAPPAAAGAPPPKKRSKLPLILALGGLVFVLLLIAVVLMMVGGGEKTAEIPVPTPTPVPTPAEPAVSPVEQGDRFAAALEIDQALQSWESAIEGGNDEVRAKYAVLAYDAAMVHAAANDVEKSRSYLERVVKFGPPDSPEVEAAKARIGS